MQLRMLKISASQVQFKLFMKHIVLTLLIQKILTLLNMLPEIKSSSWTLEGFDAKSHNPNLLMSPRRALVNAVFKGQSVLKPSKLFSNSNIRKMFSPEPKISSQSMLISNELARVVSWEKRLDSLGEVSVSELDDNYETKQPIASPLSMSSTMFKSHS